MIQDAYLFWISNLNSTAQVVYSLPNRCQEVLRLYDLPHFVIMTQLSDVWMRLLPPHYAWISSLLYHIETILPAVIIQMPAAR